MCDMGKISHWKSALAIAGLAFGLSSASSVAVHDPSVVLVYKDASGNSYPEQDASKSRAKYYYIFGTMGGAAYSKDLINWTEFTPTYLANGTLSTDFSKIVSVGATWSGWTTASDAQTNYWAPDIIWNKSMKKWCIYYSENGDDWKSSIGLLTSDQIEGPYSYAGTVVFGGMDSGTSGAGNEDYKKVTGSSTIANRYYMRNNGTYSNGWDGGYGVSAIDPNVFYDQSGNLWLLYGSWSGGLFMLKLDPSTGLRDYSYSYGTSEVWDNGALQSDPYMGIHVAGGYYVSGEGSYVEYMKDADGNGYYYMFISYGFYSPDGGYTMRVFRSKEVTGPYTDVTGDKAIFSKYIYNYGTNTTYGYPIIQGYRWSFWDEGSGEVADGHNSLLTDDDGRYFVVYHRKMTNGTAWHNVETHELVFNKAGWIVPLPFEHRVGYGLPDSAIALDEIAGLYHVILHAPFAQADGTTPVSTEQDLYLNADGTISGAYTGTWTYDYAKGRHYATIVADGTTFNGVMAVQLQNDVSKKTVTFSAMNTAGERTLWGYRVPETENLKVTHYGKDSRLQIGKSDYSTAWNAYDEFHQVSVPDSFAVEYKFVNHSEAKNNYNNWILAFENGSERWYLRSDLYSLETFSGSTVGSVGTWGDDWASFRQMYQDAEVTLKAKRSGTTINVAVYIGDSLVSRNSATNTPSGDYTIYLGADAAYLEVSKVAYGENGSRVLSGAIDAGGVYTSAFNTAFTPTYSAPAGDFTMKLKFANYANGTGSDNWDNFILREISGSKTTLFRADIYALDDMGTTSFTSDWNWDDWNSIMRNAEVELSISRSGSEIAIAGVITAENGDVYHYGALQTGAPMGEISFGLTVEQSAVDLFRVESVETIGSDTEEEETTFLIAKKAKSSEKSLRKVRENSQILLQKGASKAYRLNGTRVH